MLILKLFSQRSCPMDGQLAARHPSTWTSSPPRLTEPHLPPTWMTCSGPWTAPAPVRTPCLPDGSLSPRTDLHHLMSQLLLRHPTLHPQTRLHPRPRPPASLQDHRQMSPRLRLHLFHLALLLLSRHLTPLLLSRHLTPHRPSCSDILLRTSQPLPCLPTSPPLPRLHYASMTTPSMRRCCSL